METVLKLAVSVLNYRTADLSVKATQATIDALLNRDFSWHIFIVDNDSQDSSENTLRAHVAAQRKAAAPGWDKVEVHQTGHNGGFGAGNNYAIKTAQAQFPELEYVYILNSDAFPEKDAIVSLMDFLDSNPNYGFAGSYIYGTDDEPHNTAFRFPSPLGELEGAVRFGPVTRLLRNYQVPMGIQAESCDADWLAGASMLMRIKTLDAVGLFDETFFLYFEETDLSLRAQRAGWPTRYIAQSRVLHIGSVSTGMKKWQRIPQYWLDSRKHYFVKNHGRMTFLFATFLRTLGGLLYQLRCLVEGKKNPDPDCFIRDMLRHAFK
ncbi:MAG: glycosyltransferase family 2 protein [Pricia sp.]